MNDLTTIQPLAMIAGLVLLLLWEQSHPFFDYFRGHVRDRGRHVLRNLIIGGLNALLIALLFVGVWFAVAQWSAERDFGVLHWLRLEVGLPTWAHVVGAVLLLDAWTYVWHRLNHVVPFFWRFHRVHHSDPHMDVTTASRFHVGEIFFSSLLRIPLIALGGIYFFELLFYETLMFAVVQFHHANVAVPDRVDRALRTLIVTPAMHKVHHSRWRPETDSNYSSLLSIWDRIGRTFRLSRNLGSIRLGLDEFSGPEHHTVTGMLRTPLLDRSRSAHSEDAVLVTDPAHSGEDAEDR